jgi:hypothetical protein
VGGPRVIGSATRKFTGSIVMSKKKATLVPAGEIAPSLPKNRHSPFFFRKTAFLGVLVQPEMDISRPGDCDGRLVACDREGGGRRGTLSRMML